MCLYVESIQSKLGCYIIEETMEDSKSYITRNKHGLIDNQWMTEYIRSLSATIEKNHIKYISLEGILVCWNGSKLDQRRRRWLNFEPLITFTPSRKPIFRLAGAAINHVRYYKL